LDDELEALLLRQLYLTELEEGNDTEALEIAERMVDLGTLGDIARQDAARAALALNAVDAAIDHITIAAHICPTERRSFHYCHLGAILRSRGRDLEAVEALRSAERFAQTDHPMYRAALALAENQESAQAPDWTALREQLEGIENKKGYLLWVLGEVCLKDGDRESGREYLTRFLERLDGAPRAKSLSLCSEIAHASELLHDSES
jgi:tetratricopeptide (TPR) repeat protein